MTKHISPARAVVLAVSLAWAAGAMAQTTEQPRYVLKQEAPTTGSSVVRNKVTSELPLDKRYDQLTDEQKAIVRAKYEDMKPEDEPPFPRDGLGKLYDTLRKGAAKLGVHGDLSLWVRVDGQGDALSAEVLLTPDEEWGRFAASVALLTPFKPAVCSGAPCTMDFPIRLSVTR